MTASLRCAAGSLLVVGLGGTELTGMERAWVRLVRPAGIILFKRNIEDRRQTRALLNDLTPLGAPRGIRCVDVEGGTVDRLRDALAPIPSAQAVARAALDSNRPQIARQHGALVAQALKAFGFNTALAPVLDLALPESAQVMGTRTASAAPDGVVNFARAFLCGLADEGVAGCGKHFPGLGGGSLDSHLETPAIQRSMKEIWQQDLAPYRELRGQLPMVMVNHAAYPATPGKSTPASVSAYWITTVLRKRIGYRGIVFSDDLEMGGILKFVPIEEAAVAAVRAGMDLMEICHSPELILRAHEALVEEAERSVAFRKMFLARANRTSRLRARLFTADVAAPLSVKQFEALRSRILSFGESIAKTSANEVQTA